MVPEYHLACAVHNYSDISPSFYHMMHLPMTKTSLLSLEVLSIRVDADGWAGWGTGVRACPDDCLTITRHEDACHPQACLSMADAV